MARRASSPAPSRTRRTSLVGTSYSYAPSTSRAATLKSVARTSRAASPRGSARQVEDATLPVERFGRRVKRLISELKSPDPVQVCGSFSRILRDATRAPLTSSESEELIVAIREYHENVMAAIQARVNLKFAEKDERIAELEEMLEGSDDTTEPGESRNPLACLWDADTQPPAAPPSRKTSQPPAIAASTAEQSRPTQQSSPPRQPLPTGLTAHPYRFTQQLSLPGTYRYRAIALHYNSDLVSRALVDQYAENLVGSDPALIYSLSTDSSHSQHVLLLNYQSRQRCSGPQSFAVGGIEPQAYLVDPRVFREAERYVSSLSAIKRHGPASSANAFPDTVSDS